MKVGGSDYIVKCGRCQAPKSSVVKTSLCTSHPHAKPTCADLTHLSAGDGVQVSGHTQGPDIALVASETQQRGLRVDQVPSQRG